MKKFSSSGIYPLLTVSGRCNDSRDLVDKTIDHITSLSGLMGPELLKSTDAWTYVARNGTHNLEADLRILHQFIEVVVTRDPDSDYITVQAITPSVMADIFMENPFYNDIVDFIVSKIDEPVLWLFAAANDNSGETERPYATLFRRLIPGEHTVIDSDSVKVTHGEFGIPTLECNGMTSIMEYMKPYVSGLQDKITKALDYDVNDDDEDDHDIDGIVNVLKDLITLPGETIELFEMEYGPMSKLFDMAMSALMVRIAARNVSMSNLYRGYRSKYSSIRHPQIKYPSFVITYMSSDFDMIKATVEVEASEGDELDLTSDDIIISTTESPQDFFS